MGGMILCPICSGSGIMRTFELVLEHAPAAPVVEARCSDCGGSGTINPRAARDLLVANIAAALADELDGITVATARVAVAKLEAWGWLR